MTLKQKLTKFFQANPNLSKESGTLYSAYKVKKYTYDEVEKQHNLTVVAKDPNSKNQNNYQLERIGDLHPDLIKCLQEKEEIVYFWTGNKLEASDPFFLEGGGYHWTVFLKRYLIEKQNAQEWLDKYYPKEKRSKIEKLEISGIKTKTIGWKLLEGHLDLQDFANLKYFDCSDNLLTSLNVGNCLQLEELYCSNNKLTKVDQILSSLNPEKLKNLDLSFNIKRFIKKWGRGEEIKENGKEELSELNRLQSPQEFNKYWYTGGVKWLARAGATAGGVLALNDNPTLGGIFAATFPLLEVVASRVEEQFYDAKEKEWEEFVEDAKNFLDNYHELVGILKTIQIGELGKVNSALEDLDKKVNEFVKQYDSDHNRSIDIFELKEAKNRRKLGQDLSKEKPKGGGSQLGDIVLAMKKLEEEVIAYQQGKRDKKNEEQTNENTQPYLLIDIASHNQEVDEEENNSQTENASDNNSSAPVLNNQVINKDKKIFSLTSSLKKWGKSPTHSDESYELQNQEQIVQTLHVPPYGIPGSSKK